MGSGELSFLHHQQMMLSKEDLMTLPKTTSKKQWKLTQLMQEYSQSQLLLINKMMLSQNHILLSKIGKQLLRRVILLSTINKLLKLKRLRKSQLESMEKSLRHQAWERRSEVIE